MIEDLETINKWLKEKYGISYTELNKEFNSAVELSNKRAKKIIQKDKEIERLNNDIKILLQENENKEKVIKAQDNIINKAIEYIEEKYDYILKDDTFLDHDERIDRKQVLSLLDIFKGVDKE